MGSGLGLLTRSRRGLSLQPPLQRRRRVRLDAGKAHADASGIIAPGDHSSGFDYGIGIGKFEVEIGSGAWLNARTAGDRETAFAEIVKPDFFSRQEFNRQRRFHFLAKKQTLFHEAWRFRDNGGVRVRTQSAPHDGFMETVSPRPTQSALLQVWSREAPA